jgi:hypothetical protein
MNRQRNLTVAGLFVTSLAIIGGCANPRGTASALSAVIPVSSPAVSGSAVSGSAVSGNAGVSTDVHDSTQIYGAVTADSERQLVLTYLGGDCDVSARGEATENGPITVQVVLKSSGGICSAVGYIRTAVAPLSAPWGNRAVRDVTGATVPVIDGSLLLRPSWLPHGYQGGGITVGASEGGNATANQEWGPPSVTATSTAGVLSCPPSPGVTLLQGYGITPTEPLVPGSYSLADGTPVTVTRDQQNDPEPNDPEPNDPELYWTPPRHPKGWTVALFSAPQCGNALVPLDTLMKIANGLH